MANIEEKKDKELFKKFRDNSEMTALLAIFAGLVFVFAPQITERLIGYLLGSVAIIAGMFFILKYVKKDIKNDFYSHDFVTGVFLCLWHNRCYIIWMPRCKSVIYPSISIFNVLQFLIYSFGSLSFCLG